MSLSVSDITVRLGGRDVLHDVSLDVDDREVVAVLGPSGSGKTTLLRVIAGLQAPTAGRVLIDGRDVTDVPTHRRGVGLMFQDHALFPHRDVAGNVGFGLRMAGVDRAETQRRTDEVLELVGLAGFAARTVEGLSGGERQRVALARALAPRPAILLLDEPLGALDRALRDRLLDDLAEVLAHSGSTVVHVTHDQGEAFATGQRIVVMRAGSVAQVGPPHELWLHPVDAQVARIVGPTGVIPVEMRGGEVHAPWGRVQGVHLATSRPGPAQLLLRPDDAVVVEPELSDAGMATTPVGALRGRITSRAFRGDQVLLRVAVDLGDGREAEVPVVAGDAATLATGAEVLLRLRAGRGVVVAPT
jgi:thiamine transport system ATP-binding protein